MKKGKSAFVLDSILMIFFWHHVLIFKKLLNFYSFKPYKNKAFADGFINIYNLNTEKMVMSVNGSQNNTPTTILRQVLIFLI